MAEPIGVGIIGAGEISLLHAAAYRALGERVRLAAVAPGRRAAPPGAREGRAAPLAARRIHWGEGSAESPVYDWLGLPAGAVIPGPAVLETDETTLLVPPGATGTVGRLGELKMDTGAGRRAMASAEVPRHLPIEAAR